jgi:hypothetical protein
VVKYEPLSNEDDNRDFNDGAYIDDQQLEEILLSTNPIHIHSNKKRKINAELMNKIPSIKIQLEIEKPILIRKKKQDNDANYVTSELEDLRFGERKRFLYF